MQTGWQHDEGELEGGKPRLGQRKGREALGPFTLLVLLILLPKTPPLSSRQLPEKREPMEPRSFRSVLGLRAGCSLSRTSSLQF